MKLFFFIVAFVCVTLSSCRTSKQVSTTAEVTKTRDSINIIHIKTIDTIRVPEQKLDGKIPAEILKQLGEYSVSKNGLTTKLLYVHDTLYVETTKDSTMLFKVRELIKEYNSKIANQSVIKTDEKTTTIHKKNFFFGFWFWLIIILIICIIVIIYNPFKFLTLFNIFK